MATKNPKPVKPAKKSLTLQDYRARLGGGGRCANKRKPMNQDEIRAWIDGNPTLRGYR